MSSGSSPTRSASPSNSEASETRNSSAILTPRRKIRTMLAAFDDDSEVDSSTPMTRHIVSRDALDSIGNAKTPERLGIIHNSDDDDDDIVPKGRVAARMRAQRRTDEIGPSSSDEAERAYERAYERLTKQLNGSQQGSSGTETESEEGSSAPSEDELPTARLKRKLRKARNLAPDEEASPQRQSRQRSISPLFVPLSGAEDRGSEVSGPDDNNGLESGLKPNSRVLALVKQRRKKREEKERIEKGKKAARAEHMKQFSSEIFSSEDSDDDGSARKLTQQSRPTRKAGKKALEEMNRETQRMSRNMELTHQARTKKKITKESFFARFNSMQTQGMERSQSAFATPSMNSSSPPPSDAEGQKEYISPLTSPLREPATDTEKLFVDTNQQADVPMDLPSIEDILTREYDPPEQVIARCEEKKAKAISNPEHKPLTKQSVRVRISRQLVAQLQKDGSDSDLEVITSPAKCRRMAIFENLPSKQTQESSSILKLKALAHLTSPTRRSRAMTSAELSTMLRIQARQQATKEREERIQELRVKGVVIETAEERVAMEADVEDLMEKARKEAKEISRKENASRAKENKQADIGDSEDEDYELSGSDADGNDSGNQDEDERVDGADDGDEDDDDETTSYQGTHRLVDGEAEESDGSEDDRMDLYTSDDERETPVTAIRRKRPARVILDEEEEEQGSPTPINSAKASPQPLKRPQFPNALTSNNLSMGLSQAFAATLGNSQQDTEQDSLNIIRSLPDPGLPVVNLLQAGSQVIIEDSQEQPSEPVDLLEGYTQSDVRISESPVPRTWSQVSQIPDPTQDAGFVLSPFDQSKRFMEDPPSTIDTLILSESDSPAMKKKSRMLRRRRVADLSDIEEERDGEDRVESKASAFDIMRKASRKLALPFDKSNSKAKDIVDEAAEESEDEYAGLGGGSDDNASEEDEYDKEMINDNSGEVVDAKELAALNANHQRAMDEKQVSKLLKDITSGALHRRRGDDLDLDDSDDERMARRRQKQREFAKMRKALLADEKIGEIADNPKKLAFFKAIEDHESEDDADLDFGFLDEESHPENNTSPQDAQKDAVDNEGPRTEDKKRKRPLEPSAADVVNRPPPHLRRTAANVVSRKPSTLAEIRETLSFLTAAPDDSFHEDAFLNDDEDAFLDDGDGLFQEYEAMTAVAGSSKDVLSIHHNRRQSRDPVVDRLALLRKASSNLAPSKSANGKVAFHSASAIDAATSIGFKPPPLLRRTTTNSSSTSLNSTSSNANMGPPTTSHSKKGAVNYYTAARERERERELRVKQRGHGSNIASLLSKQRSADPGSLSGFLASGQWE